MYLRNVNVTRHRVVEARWCEQWCRSEQSSYKCSNFCEDVVISTSISFKILLDAIRLGIIINNATQEVSSNFSKDLKGRKKIKQIYLIDVVKKSSNSRNLCSGGSRSTAMSSHRYRVAGRLARSRSAARDWRDALKRLNVEGTRPGRTVIYRVVRRRTRQQTSAGDRRCCGGSVAACITVVDDMSSDAMFNSSNNLDLSPSRFSVSRLSVGHAMTIGLTNKLILTVRIVRIANPQGPHVHSSQ
jgi:hypothetical protein